MSTTKLTVIALIVFSLVSLEANAQLKLPFGKSKPKAQRQESIELTDRAGPWLIMCASFVGEDGRQQARRLAAELRDKHKLNAYVYSHEFDFGADVASKGLAYSATPTKSGELPRLATMKTASLSRFEEIAVVVGDFPSVEDSHAQKTLSELKTLKPESMAYNDLNAAADDKALAGSRLQAWREFSRQKSENPDDKYKGPLRAAFMMPNPLLPEEYFAARKVDETIIKLNRKTKNSLFNNPSKYTVKIATFTGESTFELDQIQKQKEEDAWRKKNRQGITESKLANAMKKATVLADFLRKQGVEAYEFHDRHESYVCVGGFDWLVQTDSRGVKRNHPGMVETIKKYKGGSANIAGRPGAIRSYQLPKDLAKAGIACDVQPIPVLVPKAPEKTASKLFGRYK